MFDDCEAPSDLGDFLSPLLSGGAIFERLRLRPSPTGSGLYLSSKDSVAYAPHESEALASALEVFTVLILMKIYFSLYILFTSL